MGRPSQSASCACARAGTPRVSSRPRRESSPRQGERRPRSSRATAATLPGLSGRELPAGEALERSLAERAGRAHREAPTPAARTPMAQSGVRAVAGSGQSLAAAHAPRDGTVSRRADVRSARCDGRPASERRPVAEREQPSRVQRAQEAGGQHAGPEPGRPGRRRRQHELLGERPAERRHGRQRQRADAEEHRRHALPAPEPQPAEVAGAREAEGQAGSEEQQRLEEGVRDQLRGGRADGAGAHRDQHEPVLRRRRSGERALEVGLQQRDHTARSALTRPTRERRPGRTRRQTRAPAAGG